MYKRKRYYKGEIIEYFDLVEENGSENIVSNMLIL